MEKMKKKREKDMVDSQKASNKLLNTINLSASTLARKGALDDFYITNDNNFLQIDLNGVTTNTLTHLPSVTDISVTPNKAYNFPGLKHGDKWCICEWAYKDAIKNGINIKIVPEATNI